MATCYRCGASNANYRRTTNTGFSNGNWSSKNSYGSSSRTYYGTRSVCADCAKIIDTWNIIKIVLAVIIIIVFFTRSSNNSTNKTLYETTQKSAVVTSTIGLNLRAEPNSSAKVINTIPYKSRVNIVDKSEISETIQGRKANWCKVQYNGTTGWLWSGYLKTQ